MAHFSDFLLKFVNAQTGDGNTAMHILAKSSSKHITAAEVLVDAGCDLSAVNKEVQLYTDLSDSKKWREETHTISPKMGILMQKFEMVKIWQIYSVCCSPTNGKRVSVRKETIDNQNQVEMPDCDNLIPQGLTPLEVALDMGLSKMGMFLNSEMNKRKKNLPSTHPNASQVNQPLGGNQSFAIGIVRRFGEKF